jgi:menaquinone-dependent protoporphyrinogen oxidase
MTKVLVTYGSRYGSTKGIAEFMAETIKEMGHGVDLREASKAPSSIDGYDVVLIGSGIQMGKWKNTALKFLKKHQKALRGKRIELFMSCMSSMYPEKIEESTQE